MRREFFAFQDGFNNAKALELIDRDIPAFFQFCKDLNGSLYFRLLAEWLSAKPATVLYRRLVEQLQHIQPIHILTTNADEMLEQSLGPLRVVQKTDLSICPELLRSGTPFIAKIHGTVSSVETMVFTSEDYNAIKSDAKYLGALKSIFLDSTVVFLGYGMRDQYVLELLKVAASEQELFGTGPHFIVTDDSSKSVPHAHKIAYRNDRHTDHRAALSVLSLIQQSISIEVATRVFSQKHFDAHEAKNSGEETGYYISDFKPPGRWSTEEAVEFRAQDGTVGRLTCGLGFSNDELHISASTAMHDFVVGLICFDKVYLQVLNFSALFGVLGEDLIKEVIDADALRFIHTVHVPAVIHEPDGTFGTLTILLLGGSHDKPTVLEPKETIPEITAREMFDRQITPVKGKESDASKFIDSLEKIVRVFKYPQGDAIGFELTDALLMPDIGRLLGISEAILPTQVPLWLRFPYLRMADLVHTGRICSQLGIQAAKVPFGGTRLISAAFGIQVASEWAEHVASYGVSGRFDTNLGLYVMQMPQIIRKLLSFRNSLEGQRFRREVSQALLCETGTEFTTSVNAGLKRNIPVEVLQKGHDRFLSLMTESAKITAVPAVWSDRFLSDDSTVYWRRKSLKMLMELCKQRVIAKDDPCLCGSGEKLRLCCMRPLAS